MSAQPESETPYVSPVEGYLSMGVHDLTRRDHAALDKILSLISEDNRVRKTTKDLYRGWITIEKSEIYEQEGDVITAARRLAKGRNKLAAAVTPAEQAWDPARCISLYGQAAVLGVKLANMREPKPQRRIEASRETAAYLGQLIDVAYENMKGKPRPVQESLRGVASELLVASVLCDNFHDGNGLFPYPASPRLDRPHIGEKRYSPGDIRYNRDFTLLSYQDGIRKESGVKRAVQVKTAYHDSEADSYHPSIAVISLSSHLHVSSPHEVLNMARSLTIPKDERSKEQQRRLEVAKDNIEYELGQIDLRSL